MYVNYRKLKIILEEVIVVILFLVQKIQIN